MPNRYRYAVELLRFQENDRVTKDCWSLLEIENLEWLKHDFLNFLIILIDVFWYYNDNRSNIYQSIYRILYNKLLVTFFSALYI